MGFNYFNFFKRILIFCCCNIFIIFNLSAQAKESSGVYSDNSSSPKKGFQLDPDRLIIGGGFGAQFGTVTLVELSPTIGYLLTENWLAGVGGRYIYFEEDLPFFTYKTNIYGGNLFTQYYLFENFIAHSEYELLNLEKVNNSDQRINITSVYIGGGYRSEIGNSAFGSILLLYNLNDNINSPYDNPVIRINFGFGL